jgi:Domain of unknown function DUF11
MTRFLRLFLLICMVTQGLMAQVTYNAQTQIGTNDGYFRVGSNMGYQPLFTDQNLALLLGGNGTTIPGAGVKSVRPLLPEYFLEDFGYDFRVDAFQYYQDIGMSDLSTIMGYPAEWHRDMTEYCPGIQSELFANMYEPIWDGGLNGTPYNDNNYFAAYLYKTVQLYGANIKYYEIWNEPGFDYTFACGWQTPNAACNWWTQNPNPCDYKLRAPIFHYVRMLRISWDIIKTLDPDAFVVASGLGYESFMDAILRNTDNPVDGSVTAAYPHGAGAYFDCVGFHSYPHFDGSLRAWNPAINGFEYFRHSDRAADGVPFVKNNFQNVLDNYGYDGITYPQKEWIITEINIPRKQIGDYIGSNEAQKNYVIKAVVRAMQNNVSQLDWYNLAEEATFANATFEFQMMGLYQLLNGSGLPNQVINDEGRSSKTASNMLMGTVHDAAKTASMNLPSGVGGGAFKNAAGQYTYVLWAKTTIDQSEVASAIYSFPASFGLGTLSKFEWNYGHTGVVGTNGSTNINLTATPVFFRAQANCSITATTSNILCNNNNTPTITSDDTYTYSVTVTQNGSCSGMWSGGGQTGSYGFPVTMGPYQISGGNQTLNISTTTGQTTSVTVVAPSACSTTTACAISASTANVLCNNNGTPTISTDDTYTFSVTVTQNGNCAGGWSGGGTNGTYGVAKVMGPYPISNGNQTLNLTSSTGQTASVTVVAPVACSTTGVCSITAVASNITCDDNTTPTNGLDDYFSVTLTVNQNGSCTGGWTSGTSTGTYGVPKIMGPFLITAGNKTFNIVSSTGQTAVVTVNAPAPCSSTSVCAIAANTSNVVCNNNGTANNPADDTYTFSLVVAPTNSNCIGGWTGGGTTGTYGVAKTMGPYPISGGTQNLTISSSTGQTTTVSVAAPATCSSGTGAIIDVSLLLSQANPNPAQWNSYAVVASVTNAGPQPATGLKVKMNKPTSIPYLGGNEFTASQGSFAPYGNEEWNVGTLAAGATATLTVNYYLTQANAPIAYAQVSAHNENDSDSQPNNGTPPTPNQDDEASTTAVQTPCAIAATTSNVLCNNNGTANIASDDTYTYSVLVTKTGSCTGSWSGGGTTGSYGVAKTMGPYPISGGNQTLNITSTTGQATSVTVIAPATCSTPSGGQIDVSMTLVKSVPNPAQWSTYSVTATITNAGPQPATGVKVSFPKPTGVPYSGGNEFTTSQGSFSPYGNQEWVVGSLASGATATLTATYYLTQATAPVSYAQVIAHNETDSDSQPNNGTAPTPNQDDEASTSGTVGNTCAISATTAGITCFNNNTPTNAADDVFSFTLTVTQNGNCTGGWSGGGTTGTYGLAKSMGPYPISAGNQTIAITSSTGQTTSVTVIPPATCSTTGGGCNAITITPGVGSLSIAGVVAPHKRVKVFRPNWTTALDCLDGACVGNPIIVSGLTSGVHVVEIILMDANWQPICTKVGNYTIAAASQGLALEVTNAIQLNNVYPNPTFYEIFVDMNSPRAQKATIQYFNAQGDLIETQDADLVLGRNEIRKEVIDWNTGVYYFILTDEDGMMLYGRFIKIP